MDNSYFDTVEAQITANPSIDVNVKSGMTDILKYFNESQLQNFTKPLEWRFFYKGSEQDIAKQLLENLSSGQRSYLQGQANRLAREGRADENAFLKKYFKTTYSYSDPEFRKLGYKGHHKYVEGRRIY